MATRVAYFVETSHPGQDHAVLELLHIVPMVLHHLRVSRSLIRAIAVGLELQRTLRKVFQFRCGLCLRASCERYGDSKSRSSTSGSARNAADCGISGAIADGNRSQARSYSCSCTRSTSLHGMNWKEAIQSSSTSMCSLRQSRWAGSSLRFPHAAVIANQHPGTRKTVSTKSSSILVPACSTPSQVLPLPSYNLTLRP